MKELKVYSERSKMRELSIKDIKQMVVKDAWISLKQYFDGNGNGNEAKVAAVALGIVAKEKQAENNKRAVDLAYAKHYGKEIEVKNGTN